MCWRGEGNQTVKSERLQNLIHCLGTCCLGAKQLAPECQCYPVQSEHEGQGNQFGLGDSEDCCRRGTQNTTRGGRIGQQGSMMLSTTQCGSQIGLGEDVCWRKGWNWLGCGDTQSWRKSWTSSTIVCLFFWSRLCTYPMRRTLVRHGDVHNHFHSSHWWAGQNDRGCVSADPEQAQFGFGVHLTNFPSTNMKMSYTILAFLGTTLWSKMKHW